MLQQVNIRLLKRKYKGMFTYIIKISSKAYPLLLPHFSNICRQDWNHPFSQSLPTTSRLLCTNNYFIMPVAPDHHNWKREPRPLIGLTDYNELGRLHNSQYFTIDKWRWLSYYLSHDYHSTKRYELIFIKSFINVWQDPEYASAKRFYWVFNNNDTFHWDFRIIHFFMTKIKIEAWKK